MSQNHTRPRPRAGINQDNQFFWDGTRDGKLLIQRCQSCKVLRHPPGAMCPHCQSLDWDTVEACGRGVVYSFVIAHYPQIPPFEYPNAVVLVELEEGTRIISNLVGIPAEETRIGMPVEVEFLSVDDDRTLPQFRPTEGGH